MNIFHIPHEMQSQNVYRQEGLKRDLKLIFVETRNVLPRHDFHWKQEIEGWMDERTDGRMDVWMDG